MNQKLRYLYGPILLACVAFAMVICSVIKARIEQSQNPYLIDWDYSALGAGLVILSVTIFYIISDYREKLSAARCKTVRVTLRGLRRQPESLNTWNKDERFVSGVLSIAISTGVEVIDLFDTVIRYGELTSPSAAAERTIERLVERDDWTFLKDAKSICLSFQPTGEEGHVRTSALYDRDDLKDYLSEAEEEHPEAPQVLIYTNRLSERLPQYLQAFEQPEKVIQIRTNHRPYEERHLPTLFNVIGAIIIEVKGMPVVQCMVQQIQLNHEYAVGAWMAQEGISKILLDYAVSAELPSSQATNTAATDS